MAAAEDCVPSRRRRRPAPHGSPGTSCLDPPQLVRAQLSGLMVPAAARARETPYPTAPLLPLCCCRREWPERCPGGTFPTQSVVREHLGISPSSSSSQVWKLGIGALRAGGTHDGPVGRLWAVSVSPVSTRGQLDGCAPMRPPLPCLSLGCPLSTHRPDTEVARGIAGTGRG